MNSEQLLQFIEQYSDNDNVKIRFAWNGKHADEFEDTNYIFRKQIIETIIENPGLVNLRLVRDLFVAEAEWSREAWSVDNSFSVLGEILLSRGGTTYLNDFLSYFAYSFDTFGACHSISLNPVITKSLLVEIDVKLKSSEDQSEKYRIESARDLFK